MAMAAAGHRRDRRDLRQGEGSGLLPEKAAIGLDAAMATDLVDALDAAGFTVPKGVVAIGQGSG
jgi:hypothetical protein